MSRALLIFALVLSIVDAARQHHEKHAQVTAGSCDKNKLVDKYVKLRKDGLAANKVAAGMMDLYTSDATIRVQGALWGHTDHKGSKAIKEYLEEPVELKDCEPGEMGSKAYKARLARSSGLNCNKMFESDFGKKILKKYGWKEGEGLGARKNGRTETIQATRRDTNAGLGHEKRKAEDQWDNWWADCFNNIAKKVKVTQTPSQLSNSGDDSDDSSSDESSGKTSATGGRITAVKKANVMGGKLRRVLRQENGTL